MAPARVEEGNVYSMWWCVLDATDPRRVRYVSPSSRPLRGPTRAHAAHRYGDPDGVRVVFQEGLVERGEDLLVYRCADVSAGVARVDKRALIASPEMATCRGEGAAPW